MSWFLWAVAGWVLMTLGFIALTGAQVDIAQGCMVGGFAAFLVSFVEAARKAIRDYHGGRKR